MTSSTRNTETIPSEQEQYHQQQHQYSSRPTTTATTPTSVAMNNNNNNTNHQNILRPTEAQLRWVQFHFKQADAMTIQQERIRKLYATPLHISAVPNTLPIDLLHTQQQIKEDYGTGNNNSNTLVISPGRQLLLCVSQRQYHERKERIAIEGYDYDINDDSCNDDEGKTDHDNDENRDMIDTIFANIPISKKLIRKYVVAARRMKRKRRSTKCSLDDIERIQRFEAALYALLSSLAAMEERNRSIDANQLHTSSNTSKRWTRPEGLDPTSTSIDEQQFSDLKWSIPTNETAGNSTVAPTTTAATTTTTTTNATTKFADSIRTHFQDITRQYLHQYPSEHSDEKKDSDHHGSNHIENDDVYIDDIDDDYIDDEDEDVDDVISFIESLSNINSTRQYVYDDEALDENTKEDDDDYEKYVTRFVQTFIDQLERQENVVTNSTKSNSGSDNDIDTIMTGNGTFNSTLLNRMELLAGITLSPTLITKRHQQAIRAVESYNWAQVQYLLSANPWLAEMADVNTNQFVLHKLAFYGSGQLGIDHGTGEVICVRHPPAPDHLNYDLINLFPSSVHKLDQDGNLPLHMAALSANLPMIQLLGERFSSGASVRNEDGMLPLHLALIACASPLAATIGTNVEAVDIIQSLLRLFPSAIGVADNEGNLPIHTAESVLRGAQGESIIALLLDEADRQKRSSALLNEIHLDSPVDREGHVGGAFARLYT